MTTSHIPLARSPWRPALMLVCLMAMGVASAHAARSPATPADKPVAAKQVKTTSATAKASHARPTRATRKMRVARAPTGPKTLPPGSPPPALVGVVPAPWHDVFGEAGTWAAEPIIVGGNALGGTQGNIGVEHRDEDGATGARAGMTGVYRNAWHRAILFPTLSAQQFVGSPEYFGLRF